MNGRVLLAVVALIGANVLAQDGAKPAPAGTPEAAAANAKTAPAVATPALVQALADPAVQQKLSQQKEVFRALLSSPEFVSGQQQAQADLASMESSPELARRRMDFLRKLSEITLNPPAVGAGREAAQDPKPARPSEPNK
jgi:hypothetical protein